HGKTAADVLEGWQAHVKGAWEYVSALRGRNEALLSAAQALQAAAAEDDGPRVFGRKRQFGARLEIPPSAFADDRLQFQTDPVAKRYHNRIRFLGDLGAPDENYDQ